MIYRTKKGKLEQFTQYNCEIVEKMKKDIYNNGIKNLILSKFIKEHIRMKESEIKDYNDNNIKNKISKLHETRLQKCNSKNLMSVENLNPSNFNKIVFLK